MYNKCFQFSMRSRTPSLNGSVYSPYTSRKVSNCVIVVVVVFVSILKNLDVLVVNNNDLLLLSMFYAHHIYLPLKFQIDSSRLNNNYRTELSN